MKKLIPFIALFPFLLMFSCSQKSYTVSSDRVPSVDMNKYETYAWAEYAGDNSTAKYTLNDLLLKTYLRGEIREELEGHGFNVTESNADMLVNFIVFEKPTDFKGYGPIQEDNYYYDYYYGIEPDKDLGESRTYRFDDGTLVIQIVDKKSGKMVWQGYASGIMDGNMFDRDENNIEEAVELIFSELDARGDNYQVGG